MSAADVAISESGLGARGYGPLFPVNAAGNPRLAFQNLLRPSKWSKLGQSTGRFGHLVKCRHIRGWDSARPHTAGVFHDKGSLSLRKRLVRRCEQTLNLTVPESVFAVTPCKRRHGPESAEQRTCSPEPPPVSKLILFEEASFEERWPNSKSIIVANAITRGRATFRYTLFPRNRQ